MIARVIAACGGGHRAAAVGDIMREGGEEQAQGLNQVKETDIW